jgi:hypothetical protein
MGAVNRSEAREVQAMSDLNTALSPIALSSSALVLPVLVEWLDSLQPVSGWAMLSECPKLESAKCKSVGWVVGEDDATLMLAPNVADLESTEAQGSGFMRIPKICITERRTLK